MASKTVLLTEYVELLMPGGQMSIWPSNLKCTQAKLTISTKTGCKTSLRYVTVLKGCENNKEEKMQKHRVTHK